MMADLFGSARGAGSATGAADPLKPVLAGRGTREGLQGPCEAFVIHAVRRVSPRALEIDLGPRAGSAEAFFWLPDSRVRFEREPGESGRWLAVLEVWKAREVGLL